MINLQNELREVHNEQTRLMAELEKLDAVKEESWSKYIDSFIYIYISGKQYSFVACNVRRVGSYAHCNVLTLGEG